MDEIKAWAAGQDVNRVTVHDRRPWLCEHHTMRPEIHAVPKVGGNGKAPFVVRGEEHSPACFLTGLRLGPRVVNERPGRLHMVADHWEQEHTTANQERDSEGGA